MVWLVEVVWRQTGVTMKAGCKSGGYERKGLGLAHYGQPRTGSWGAELLQSP